MGINFVWGPGVLFLGEVKIFNVNNEKLLKSSCPIELCEFEWAKSEYYPEFPRKDFKDLIVQCVNSNPLFNNNKDLIRKLFSSVKGELWTFMLQKMDKVASENPELVKKS